MHRKFGPDIYWSLQSSCNNCILLLPKASLLVEKWMNNGSCIVCSSWELLKTCIGKVFCHWQNWTWSSSSMTVSSIISLWHVIIYIPLSWRIIKPSASLLFPMPLNLSAHLGLKKLIFWLPSRDYFFVWFWFRRTIHSRNRLNAFVLTTMINENLISLERDERRATDRHKSFVRAIDNYIKYGNRTVERTASKIS